MNKKRYFIFLILILTLFISCKKEDTTNEDTGPEILLNDDFNDSDIGSGENDWINYSVDDGFLYIMHKNDDPDYFYQFHYNYDFRWNYSIETSIAPIENPVNFNYGVMFLHKDSYNHYYFYFKQDKYFIGYVYNYNYHILKDYTQSDIINTDGSANILKILKGDHHLKFWINGEIVFESDIKNEIGDQFGYKFKRAGKVAIDYFKVYKED